MTVLTRRPAATIINQFWQFFSQAQIHRLAKQTNQTFLTELSLENLSNMKRILILGSSGSGKSTLSRKLGGQLNLPVIHLDRHYWNPGWEPTPKKEWHQKVQKLIDAPEWIIDGNYRSTLDMRLAACDAVIFLDLPSVLCVQRAIKRRFQYLNQPRPDISRGCKEHVLDPQFPQFLRWILDYPKRARPEVLGKLCQLKDKKRVIVLNSPQAVTNFLNAPEQPVTFENAYNESLTAVGGPPQFTID